MEAKVGLLPGARGPCALLPSTYDILAPTTTTTISTNITSYNQLPTYHHLLPSTTSILNRKNNGIIGQALQALCTSAYAGIVGDDIGVHPLLPHLLNELQRLLPSKKNHGSLLDPQLSAWKPPMQN